MSVEQQQPEEIKENPLSVMQHPQPVGDMPFRVELSAPFTRDGNSYFSLMDSQV